ncbi:MAG TPA: type VI secretion system tip protein VgrG [Bacteroidia bacterium]|nr:type VI secretion system tip protein VgrG [Bacteroidia bacterium]
MSDNDRTIPTPQPSDLPSLTILVDGTAISTEYKVASVDVTKVFNKLSYARIAIYDGDVAKSNFEVSNKDDFKPGKEIEVQAGYHNDNKTIFKGIVTSHSLRIRKEKGFYLIIEARDKSVKMTAGRNCAYFYNAKDSEIIEQLAGNAGVDKDVEATDVQHKEMVQYHVTDWDFILSRAEVNGKFVLTDDNKLIVKKPDTSSDAVLSIEFGSTIMDFEGEIDATTQFSTVKSHAWNYTEQELVESEGSDPPVSDNGNLTSSDLASVLGVAEFSLRHPGKFEESELKSWTDAQIVRNKLARVRGRAKFQGYADVKPGMMIELKGVGDRFNGKAFVSGVRHQVNTANWTTDVQMGFSNKWFHDAPDIVDAKSAGLVPGVNGLHIAIVTKLESDPDGEDRIQVKMPLIDNNADGTWARIATLDAGKERGSFFRPEIGDEVILGFLNDDPRNPIVLGMVNSKKLPAPLQAADANNEKGFVTREKLKLIFNDDKKSVTVETPGGQSIVIDDDSGKITIKDKNKNTVEMSSNGISMDSASDFKIKAKGDISIEGTGVTVKASGSLGLQGATSELKADGNTTVKGAMVAIN